MSISRSPINFINDCPINLTQSLYKHIKRTISSIRIERTLSSEHLPDGELAVTDVFVSWNHPSLIRPDNLESEKPPVRDYNQVTFLILNFYDDTVIQGHFLRDKN